MPVLEQPSKSMSIPRLELLAATIGVRLLTVVKKILKLPMSEYFWNGYSTILPSAGLLESNWWKNSGLKYVLSLIILNVNEK